MSRPKLCGGTDIYARVPLPSHVRLTALYTIHSSYFPFMLAPVSPPERRLPARQASWDVRIHLTSALCWWSPRQCRSLPTTTMSSISSSNAAAASFEENDILDESTALARLLEVSTAILRQGVDLVENGLTSDDQLTTHSNYIPGSTIGMFCQLLLMYIYQHLHSGKHLRHARDHFALLLDVVSSPAPHVLSYDKRLRNTPMEVSRDAAKEALNVCIAQLHRVVPMAKMGEPITLHAVTPFPQVMETTFGREVRMRSLSPVFELLTYKCHVAVVRWVARDSPLEHGEGLPHH